MCLKGSGGQPQSEALQVLLDKSPFTEDPDLESEFVGCVWGVEWSATVRGLAGAAGQLPLHQGPGPGK